ncbi:MAG TPA: alpha-amylase family glycosyl hydrolase [Bacteroidota bacterium]|nr:alpha-amylase family glycosyl hydrolase [Bacteroidota bacterium]
MKRVYALILVLMTVQAVHAADSVDVYFYFKTKNNDSNVYLPGEFNGWANNNSGVIYPGPLWNMTHDAVNGLWYRWERLQVGGDPGGGVPGAYQYKFNENGCNTCWTSDPLNPRMNGADNGNSYVYVTNPTISYLLPNSRSGAVATSTPVISAYAMPALSTQIDTSMFILKIDTTTYTNLGVYFDSTSRLFSFVSPNILTNGTHTLRFTAGTLDGHTYSDTASFYVQAGFIQLLNRAPFATLKTDWIINGSVSDTSIHSLKIIRNGVDTFAVTASGGAFSYDIPLVDGSNVLKGVADSSGASAFSSPITITKIVNHAPTAVLAFFPSSGTVTLSATSSTDPDTGQTALLTYSWSVDSSNPSAVTGVNGSTNSSINIAKPSVPGEYYFGLIVSDPDGNKDTTRNYFIVEPNGSVSVPTLASNPTWVNQGRMYLMFFKSMTSAGTINAALPYLDYIKNMGYNIIWVMPVMKNAYPMNNGSGTGYDITDFYNVAPEYGTNADFQNFVAQAHARGIKVILDVTPNHTSSSHPFVNDIRLFRQNSAYWGFYQHTKITNPNYHPNVTPEEYTSDSLFVYYSGYSDALLNYNWSDIDARAYMTNVYKWWVQYMGIDGYRMDSYWGPHDRANGGNGGENEMGDPVRAALKHIRPDILLLGETSGTGGGTEVNYADHSGGVDAAYDWNLIFNGIQPVYNNSIPATATLNQNILNGSGPAMGYLPGTNSYFLRFLEDQDEERIIHVYGDNYSKEMPTSTVVNLSVGLPLVYSGQEVGWGAGISDFDQRRRGVINWNSAGKPLLTPHYQKLAQIRKQFGPFWSQTQTNVGTGNGYVLAYIRPMANLNGIMIANFGSGPQSATITLTGTGGTPNVFLPGGAQDGKTYYASDLYNDTTYNVVFSSGTASLSVTLPAFGSAVLILSDTTHTLEMPLLTGVKNNPSSHPLTYSLEQNYPNPFNPSTQIQYSLKERTLATLKIYDVLGREVATLVNSVQTSGDHRVVWDASRQPSGVYFYRLTTASFTATKKLVLVK